MKNTLIQVAGYGMGRKDEKLSKILIEKYFNLLAEEQKVPSVIVFYNEGVKLLCENSFVTIALQNLVSKGTTLIGCGTCLDYFDLTGEQTVGIRGSMQDIISLQSKAKKVITL